MLLGQYFQQRLHAPRRFGVQRLLLGPRMAVHLLGKVLGGIGLIPSHRTMRVGYLVRGDAVHKCQERASLILVARQRCDHRETHLLRYVVCGETTSFRRSDSSAAISHHDGPDGTKYLGKRVAIASDGSSNDVVEPALRTCHRLRIPQCYVWCTVVVLLPRTIALDANRQLI
ncbi:Uncharacterised protein [Mycobacteroides abscessus subsp. abscessus]|nr:Uncharacterised protein [Mycobacteroides abscessus subsp. abscessus]